jgi:hypothetical protein
MNLRELVDTVDVPDTRVADDAWDRAHARLRRRRVGIAAGIGTAVAVVLVGTGALTPPSGQHPPAPLTGTPDPTPTTTGDAESHLPVTIVKPDWQDLGTAPALAPPADAPALSEDPVSHAALVMGDPEDQAAAYVLGDDGRWRWLDVEGLVPRSDGLYTSSLIGPTELNDTGTRLAIPQGHGLLVVNLTTGESKRYDVGGAAFHDTIWVDDTHVVVSTETGEIAHVVDLDSGAVGPTSLDHGSRVLPDGSSLAWSRQVENSYTWNGTTTQTIVNNRGGLQTVPPLLRDGIGVVISGGGPLPNPAPAYPPQILNRYVGITAVDLASGDPVGFIPLNASRAPTSSVLLGWRGDDPVLGLQSEAVSFQRLFIAAWDVNAGSLEPLATLPSMSVGWGVGL